MASAASLNRVLPLSILLLFLPSSFSILRYQNAPLLELFEKAFVNDTANLVKLWCLLYPPEDNQGTFWYTGIRFNPCDFKVDKITNPSSDEEPFISCRLDFNCSDGNFCYNDTSLRFVLLNDGTFNPHFKLSSFVQGLWNTLLLIDSASFEIFNSVTHSHLNTVSYTGGAVINLTLSLNELETMPSQDEVIKTLTLLLSWAKYYTRSNGNLYYTPRLDTDKMLAYASGKPLGRITETLSDYKDLGFFISYIFINVFIALTGICQMPKVLNEIKSLKQRNPNLANEIDTLYWATVTVCAAVNVLCTYFYFYDVRKFYSEYSAFLYNEYHESDGNYFIEIVYFFIFMVLIFMFEVTGVWIIIKDFKMSTSICLYFIRRAIHTLAICHILWFLHRVSCNLLVAIAFIALAPAQTLATIILLYSAMAFTVLYLTYNLIHVQRMKCSVKHVCKMAVRLFVAFLFYWCLFGLTLFLTIFFSELSNNGLTASGLGSVILSFVAPTVVFFITLRLKRILEKRLASSKLIDLTTNFPKGKTTEAPENKEKNSEHTSLLADP